VFTGIIQELGIVKSVNYSGSVNKIKIECPKIVKNAKLGDSIAVNGVCLTVCSIGDKWFEADVMPETMRRTSLANLKPSGKVNLEPALRLDERLGGHLISGHIDGVGSIKEIRKEQNAVWMSFKATPEILRYIVMKGSVSIDGISLTVAEVDSSCFCVSLIPGTLANTILNEKKVGETVNIECDIVGKYIEKFLLGEGESFTERKGLDIDFLSDNGFL